MNDELKNNLFKIVKEYYLDISLEELDEVINLYNNVMDFYLDGCSSVKGNRFDFVNDRNHLTRDNMRFYNIFRLLIEFKRNNLVKYLDYILLLNSYFYINELYEFEHSLETILSKYRSFHEDFIYKYMEIGPSLQEVLNKTRDIINLSTLIPSKYKEIMNLYDDIYIDYFDKEDDEAYFYVFLDTLYYYFIENEMFNNNPDDVLDFLKKIKNSLQDYIYRVNYNGPLNYQNMFTYIDILYKTKDKTKIMK